MIATAYHRKKQPEVIRRAILDAAARIAAQEGLASVTIQAVAVAVGVTKGGVFHHFASKQMLLQAMLEDMLDRLDAEIDNVLTTDSGYGCFTRAYVLTTTVGETFGIGSPFDTISMALIADKAMSDAWQGWMDGRLIRHRDTDSDPALEVVRFAADGAWLAHLGSGARGTDFTALKDRLVAMTRGSS